MTRRGFLLALAGLLAAHQASAQGCPAVSGYAFYRLQDATGAYVIKTLDAAGSAASIGGECTSTRRCNAFTTAGQLKIVPAVPIFELMDASSPDTLECDGIYIASRTLTGLVLPAGVNADTLRQQGQGTLRNMQAAIAAANKVSGRCRTAG
ncbi:hypothetical protein TSOC_001950 [Tetrabaena socialis]|uniref:Uncharacterized protein n=1 Tax=Tetrabaena socialis TaxID=47790 RepID=A0A2J8AFH7_9CHLO|nr:hypothetical protein TSOC_001950 [Tetrabaena socialis]|eukprot:PNH11242.1 hypothetical protein TSOC_001950 [Tetrabaena socialis]